MSATRRQLLFGAAALGTAACSGGGRAPTSSPQNEDSAQGAATGDAQGSAAPDPGDPPNGGKQRILVLGGTGFLGPHFVRAAVEAGHEVTLFNRGKTNTHLFPGLEKFRGDRDGGLHALASAIKEGRRWDAVLDTSGYVPRLVRDSAGLLRSASERYLFVSSISVYDPADAPGLDEGSAVGRLPDPTVEKVGGETYGPLKALCEEAAESVYGPAAIVVRPGLIVGPGDPTDRFTYWPVRCARGGDMIAPGHPTDPTQVIDARDLSSFMLRLFEAGQGGRFNATGPLEPTSMAQLLEACIAAAGGAASPVWIDAEFLEKQEVAPWMHMPAWVPPKGEGGGILQVSIDRARAAGLSCRPLRETAADTLAWWNDLPEERRAAPRAGLDPKREAAVLEAWRSKRG